MTDSFLLSQQNIAEHGIAEETFRRAFEHAAFGMVLVGSDGCFLQVNRAACDMFGYPAEELITKTFQELTFPEDLEVGVELFQDLVSGRQDFGWLEKRYVRKDGKVIWTLLSTSAVRDRRGKLLYLVSQIQDITERKAAEANLAETEAQYRSIFEAALDGLIINKLDGTIVEVNPAFCEMHGYARQELLGLCPTSFIHPDDHPIFESYLQAVRAGRGFQGRAVDLRKDGTPFHVEIHGTPFAYGGEPHVLGVVRDITEQVQAQKMLEERVAARTRELTALYDVAAVASASLDLKHVMEKSLEQILGVMGCTIGYIHLLDEAETVLRLAAWQGTPPEVLAEIEAMPADHGVAARAIAHGSPLVVPTIDTEPSAVPGGECILAGHAYIGASMCAKGKILGVLSVIGPVGREFTVEEAALLGSIADQVGAAAENAQLYERAEALAVAEERQRLAREIHDTLAQGFTGIKLQLEAVESALERQEADLALVRLSHARRLAEQSLAEARSSVWALRSRSLEEKKLGDALRDSVRGLTDGTGLSVAIETEEQLPRLPRELEGDLLRVAQEAVINVVKHAQAKHLSIHLGYKANRIELQIRDDGKGFSVDGTQGHSHDGSGFGLTSMRERMARHGGRLEIDTQHGHGTRIIARVESEFGGV
jgi:PAS domain S-box-containing protein